MTTQHFGKIAWIGTPTVETNVCIARAGAEVKTVADLQTKTLIVGDTGAGTGTHSYPRALTDILGMKFKLVSGFPSSSDVFLAMERVSRGHYRVTAEWLTRPGETGLVPREATRRYAERLEAVIRAHPADWFWGHRRWKLQKPLYG